MSDYVHVFTNRQTKEVEYVVQAVDMYNARVGILESLPNTVGASINWDSLDCKIHRLMRPKKEENFK